MNASFVKAVGDKVHEDYYACLDFCKDGKSGLQIASMFENIFCIFNDDMVTFYVSDSHFINSDLNEVQLDSYRLENIDGTRYLIIEKQIDSQDPFVIAKEITRLVDDIHNAFNLNF